MGEAVAPVRFGVMGCARIAWKVCRGMLRVEGVEVHAVASRSLQKAQAFAEQIKGLAADIASGPGRPCSPIAYGSYEALLEDKEIDAVYIPLPTGLHAEWVVKAAEHGKHILLEKPVALSMADLDLMLAACDKAGVQIMDGTMWVHSPRAAAMREVLDDPTRFGVLKRVTSSFCFKGSDDFLASNIRVQKGLDELGCLGDIGWYCIRAALWARHFQMPSYVVAAPGAIRNEHGVLISCGGTLVWEDGVVATFECGFDAPLRQLLQFAGSRSTVHLDDFTIPHREDRGEFIVDTDAAIVDQGIRTSYSTEKVLVMLPIPQEALMVQSLARIVSRVRKDGRAALQESWRDCLWKTMRVLLAVDDSAAKSGALVML